MKRRLVLFLTPGIGLKRWLALATSGATFLLLGLALAFASLTEISQALGE